MGNSTGGSTLPRDEGTDSAEVKKNLAQGECVNQRQKQKFLRR